MHLECLRDDVLRRIYDRLGADLPHIPAPPVIKKEEEPGIEKKPLREPLSPPTMEYEQPLATIAVHGDANTPATVKQSDEDTPKPPESTLRTTQLPHHVKSKGVARPRGGRGRASNVKSYEGLFEVNLRMNDGPMAWEVQDKRDGVIGGSKTWTEPALCLLCDCNIE